MKIEFHVYDKVIDKCFMITKYTSKMTPEEAIEFADKACDRFIAKEQGNKASYLIESEKEEI